VSHEGKKFVFTMPIHESGMHNLYTRIAFYGFHQAIGIINQLAQSYGMPFASPDSWIGTDNYLIHKARAA
jgi:hypothetical protein